MKKKIAILGATSHIAKGLICSFNKSNTHKLFLFARSPARLKEFLNESGLKKGVVIGEFKGFPSYKYDVVINCVGAGTPNEFKNDISSIFRLTEDFDNIVISYLDKFPRALYINFSSGAVYGKAFSKAAREGSICKLEVNNLKMQDCYSIAKINAEAKHRVRRDLNIVDIRIFSYFSRFIDLDSGYFLADVIKSIKEGKDLLTDSCDFIRDYIGKDDLFNLIRLIISRAPFNGFLDAYSKSPVSKFKLLEFFTKKYGLIYAIKDNIDFNCPTGKKNVYSSKFHAAAKIGYKPKFSSFETVKIESGFML
ncbi:MAG: NAD-dependent epimerase/dehydratase family protein [Candidatus Omnitrophota bacterium]|jgi:NAD dependent epimerase/dehydratase family enzyme